MAHLGALAQQQTRPERPTYRRDLAILKVHRGKNLQKSSLAGNCSSPVHIGVADTTLWHRVLRMQRRRAAVEGLLGPNRSEP